MMKINNLFNIGDVVYLKTDPEDKQHIVIEFTVSKYSITYRVAHNGVVIDVYDFELSVSPSYGVPFSSN